MVTEADFVTTEADRRHKKRAGLLRSDQEIIEEIREHVIGDILWIDPERVDIKSVEGNVVLRGRLETRSDTELLARLTARVDGVASVANHLEFEVDNTKLEMISPPMGMGIPRNW